ncbi:ribonuclease R family protein [Estrella lausannensis]|uniref:Ribonuclease R n=1 Tax=Estrella lausannensis TaxID=483423 RepID=A0A0H5E814_9BACT|nr:ribonuclease R family protein [Estrella lausannensis]CRX39490.1 Ribonuclease R [Estrella lausannensis]
MAKKRKKSKQVRLKDNLTKVLREFLGARKSPLTVAEILQRLSLPEEHAPVIEEILTELKTGGEMAGSGEGFSVKQKPHPEGITGTIRMHPKGFGFVVTDPGFECGGDIFIPKHLTQNAVDGDRVEAVLAAGPCPEKGPEGRVSMILERSRKHLAGIVSEIDNAGYFHAYAPLLGTSQRIFIQPSHEVTLSVGDRIVMEILDWGSKEKMAEGKWLHTIGSIHDPKIDIPAAIEEFDLSSTFPIKALNEAKLFGARVKKSDLEGRLDLTQDFTTTIDPDTAKDFDDAISIEKGKKGYKLGVHIADVSHYVKPGGALDKEAERRCNSTYFPGMCLPMLPKELSENLCSLRPNCIRLTYSALMEFDKKGEMTKYTIQRSYIKSAKRLTYKQAKKLLDSDKESPLRDKLLLMVELATLLKKQRMERGSVDLALPELIIKVDDQGVPTGTETVEYDITHQMIEEFMLKANETVATHLANEGKSVAYRVHDIPQEENIQEFALMARSFGFEIEDNPSPQLIQKLFAKAVDTPYGQYLATNYIRRMRMAYYSPDNIGHYGLSLTHYCHFTSPIRRYADLIIHRLLSGEPVDEQNLDKITSTLSEQERLSSKAEQNVVLLKKLRYLAALKSNEPFREFKAVVTSVKPFGITIDILDIMLETFIHISEIGKDYYEYNERRKELKGRSTGETFTTGTPVTAFLHNVDLIMKETKWELLSEVPDKSDFASRGKERKHRPERAKKNNRRRRR